MFISAKTTLLLALLVSIAPAYAQGYATKKPMVNRDNLEHTTFNRSPLQISIVDDGPIVTDHRRVPQSKPLIINIPPLQGTSSVASVVPGNAVQVGDGIYVVGGGSPSANRRNPMLGNGFLPNAGFSSYTPKQAITAGRDLPSGTTTGIHGRMEQAPSMVSSQPSSALSRPSKPGFAREWAPAEIALYHGPNVSIGGAQHSTTKATVKGTIVQKILDKQK